MELPDDIPAWLEPDKHFGDLHVLKLTKIWNPIHSFSREFGIGLETATLSVLAGLAHAMGGTVRVSATFGSIEPPFSLLLVTPESDPVWTEVPVRFLLHEFSPALRQCQEAYLIQRKMEGCAEGEEPSDNSLKNAAEVANRLTMDGMVERICTTSLLFPFPRSLIDNHVLVGTPAIGIRKALGQLPSLQKAHLENALSTSSRLVAPDGVRSSAVPSFYWQVSERELPALLDENGWLTGVPFVAVKTTKPGCAQLDPSKESAADLLNRGRELVAKRNAIKGYSRRIQPDAKTFDPIREFLERAQNAGGSDEPETILSPRRIAELGMKFTAILTVLNRQRQPDTLEVKLGLELAKLGAARRHRVLQGASPAEAKRPAPNLAGLTSRERAVFLRIMERRSVSRSDLGRSFNRMRKDERDHILAKLAVRNLVELRNGSVLPTRF